MIRAGLRDFRVGEELAAVLYQHLMGGVSDLVGPAPSESNERELCSYQKSHRSQARFIHVV